MVFVTVSIAVFKETAQFFDEIWKIDSRRTPIITESAGQTRPDAFLYRRGVDLARDDVPGQSTGRKGFAR